VWPFTDRRAHPAGRRSAQVVVSTVWIEAPR
jgi:hypothetical protein